MKPGFDIKLTTLHLGECHRVVTLDINGKDYASSFLTKLYKDDSRKWKSLVARIRAVSERDHYENEQTFRSVGQGVFEFKRPSLRLYAFYDTINGHGHLILCTNGGHKNTKKEQQSNIKKAKAIQSAYLLAKKTSATTLELTDPPE